MIEGLEKGQQVEPSKIAPDGTIICPRCEADLISVDVADVDLLLSFSDGTYVIIPNGAFDAISDSHHPVVFKDQNDISSEFDHSNSDHKSTLGDLFKMVGITTVAEGGSLRVVSEKVEAEKIPEEVRESDARGNEPVSPNDGPIIDRTSTLAPVVKVDRGNTSSGKDPGLGASVTTSQTIDIAEDDPVIPTITPRPTVYKSAQETIDTSDPTVTIDGNITADDIINIAESGGNVAITGIVGGSAQVGDTVTLSLSGETFTQTYTGEVLNNKTFNIDVSGGLLVTDDDLVIEASITVDGAYNPGTDTEAYGVDIIAPATPGMALANDRVLTRMIWSPKTPPSP